MRWRNGEHGYGVVTKTLHWSVLALLVAQVVVGLSMDVDDDDLARAVPAAVADDSPAERREGRREERRDRLEDRREDAQDRREEQRERAEDTRLLPLHIGLGITALGLGLVRLLWRRTTPLPPWSERLSPAQRTWLHLSETVLLTTTIAVPLTGLLLVLLDGGLVALHVGTLLVLAVGLAVHLAVVLPAGVLPRMLPGGRTNPAATTDRRSAASKRGGVVDE